MRSQEEPEAARRGQKQPGAMMIIDLGEPEAARRSQEEPGGGGEPARARSHVCWKNPKPMRLRTDVGILDDLFGSPPGPSSSWLLLAPPGSSWFLLAALIRLLPCNTCLWEI